jgi:hypothetical protein
MEELMARLERPERYSAAGKLTRGILDTLNAKSPLAVGAREFNQGAEKFYRETLRQRHMIEALHFLGEDCRKLDKLAGSVDDNSGEALAKILGAGSATAFLQKAHREVLAERIEAPQLRKLIGLLLLTVHRDSAQADNLLQP